HGGRDPIAVKLADLVATRTVDTVHDLRPRLRIAFVKGRARKRCLVEQVPRRSCNSPSTERSCWRPYGKARTASTSSSSEAPFAPNGSRVLPSAVDLELATLARPAPSPPVRRSAS